MRCHHALPDRACARLNWLIDWPVVRHAIYNPLLAASSPVSAPGQDRLLREDDIERRRYRQSKFKNDDVRPINCTTSGASHQPDPQRDPGQDQPHQRVQAEQLAAVHAPAAERDIFLLLAADQHPGQHGHEIQDQPGDRHHDDHQLLGELVHVVAETPASPSSGDRSSRMPGSAADHRAPPVDDAIQQPAHVRRAQVAAVKDDHASRLLRPAAAIPSTRRATGHRRHQENVDRKTSASESRRDRSRSTGVHSADDLQRDRIRRAGPRRREGVAHLQARSGRASSRPSAPGSRRRSVACHGPFARHDLDLCLRAVERAERIGAERRRDIALAGHVPVAAADKTHRARHGQADGVAQTRPGSRRWPAPRPPG